jgi:signal transduction histidine kinase
MAESVGRAPRWSMRRHVALTLAGLSALAVISLGCVYAITEYVIEKSALRREMSDEIRACMLRWERGESDSIHSSTLRYFPAGQVPPGLSGLVPGAFDRLHLEGRPVQALAEADPAGRIHVIVHDLALTRRRESSLLLSLLAGVAIAAGGAWLVSGWLARRILSPLTALVKQIQRVDPLRPTQDPVVRTGDPELDAIPDAINRLIEELDHVLQRERAFADAASHELRTPIAVVRGAIDVLRELDSSPPAVVERMDRAARRAQEDLTALLALSPARRPPPSQLVDLREILPAAGEPYVRGLEGETRIVWEWGEGTEVSVEPTALAIVFTNILRNALRAAPQGEVRVSADRRGVRVVDDGEGLPEGWPENQEPRGRGLGLSIARILAERNGWRLEVGQAQPHGTRAELRLASDPTGDDANPVGGPT